MARAKSTSTGSAQSTANIGFEAKLWLTADKLHFAPGEYAGGAPIPTFSQQEKEQDYGAIRRLNSANPGEARAVIKHFLRAHL